LRKLNLFRIFASHKQVFMNIGKKMQREHLPIICMLAVVILSFSCNRFVSMPREISQAEAVIDYYPDSAYNILLQAKGIEEGFGSQRVEMRYRLLMTQAQNSLSLEMPSDSSFKEVVKYYDKHGSPNDRMQAYYLLGSIYRDMQEAPIALAYYRDAISCADTTAQNCNYTTLSKIYGQMAFICYDQYLTEEGIDALKKASYYALKDSDTFNYIKSLELTVNPYYSQGDTAQVLRITERCHDLYMKNGMPQAAAGVYAQAIQIYVERKQYETADSLIRIFENESGLFDAEGNIGEGRDDYFFIKGQYLLGTNAINDAERCFRKLLSADKKVLAYYGLLQVFLNKEEIDSIAKYSALREKSLGKMLEEEQAQAILQSKALYNYNRWQRVADQEKTAAKNAKIIIVCIILGIILLTTIAVIWYRRNSKKKKRYWANLQKEYALSLQTLKKMEAELETIESVNDRRLSELHAKKQEEIALLTQKISKYESDFARLKANELDAALMNSDILEELKKKAVPKPGAQMHATIVSASERKELLEQIKLCLPTFYAFLIGNHNLTPQEFDVCILTRLNFSNKEIATLLGTGTQNIPNAKKRANKKLFNEDTALSLQKNLLHKIS